MKSHKKHTDMFITCHHLHVTIKYRHHTRTQIFWAVTKFVFYSYFRIYLVQYKLRGGLVSVQRCYWRDRKDKRQGQYSRRNRPCDVMLFFKWYSAI